MLKKLLEKLSCCHEWEIFKEFRMTRMEACGICNEVKRIMVCKNCGKIKKITLNHKKK